MSGVESVLQILSGLNEADRRWILDQLPADAKARLVSAPVTSDAPDSPSRADLIVAEARARVAAAQGAQLAELLRDEAPWLIHGLLQIQPWPWRRQLLQNLPASVRNDLAHLEFSGVAAGKPAADELLRTLAERLGPNAATEQPASRFEMLLARVKRKARNG